MSAWVSLEEGRMMDNVSLYNAIKMIQTDLGSTILVVAGQTERIRKLEETIETQKEELTKLRNNVIILASVLDKEGKDRTVLEGKVAMLEAWMIMKDESNKT